MILEGVLEIVLSLFLAGSVVAVFGAFPQPVIGAMLFLTAFELARVSIDLRTARDITVMLVVIAVSYVSNLGIAFVVGVLTHFLLERLRRRR